MTAQGRPNENDTGCYICQPNNPDAAEEGCPTCEREFWTAALALSRALTQRPVRRRIPPAQFACPDEECHNAGAPGCYFGSSSIPPAVGEAL